MPESVSGLVGCGLYSIPDAARILHVPSVKLRRWVSGYTYELSGTERLLPPVVRPELPRIQDSRILTFADLIELRFVSMFRNEGVSLHVIRAAAKEAANLFGTDHPFATARFNTDGKRIFAILEQKAHSHALSKQILVRELPLCQCVLSDIVLSFFKYLDAKDLEVYRYWPLGKTRRVVLDPKRSFGKPIDNDTGVSTLSLYQTYLGEGNERRVAKWYGVPVIAVRRAVEFEKSLLAA